MLPNTSASATVSLSDAGGGAGDWTVAALVQTGSGTVSVPPSVTVPGSLTVKAQTTGAAAGDVTGFVVLSRGADVRRIPFWFTVSAPQLASEAHVTLTRAGTYHATTAGGPSRISTYRYPTAGDIAYPGPERAYRVRITSPANFGVVVLSGQAVPHVTFAGSEDHLAGYTALPLDVNPYRVSYGARVKVAGVVLPSAGTYDIVFDTRSAAAAGPFTFRYWVNDVTPPKLKLVAARAQIRVAATDLGSGVDPSSIVATVDGKPAKVKWIAGTIRIAARPGRHVLALSVADFEETKNMENVPPILPNTARLRTTVTVR
jgi:hypothetical protein